MELVKDFFRKAWNSVLVFAAGNSSAIAKTTGVTTAMTGLTLSDVSTIASIFAVVIGAICAIGTFLINWYYKRKEFNLKYKVQ